MRNSEIAKILQEIGEMLELNKANPFKVVAYKNASRQIELLSEELEDIYHKKGREGLQEIPGIGESIAEKIIEMIGKEKLAYYEDLKKHIPQVELKMMEIPGIGPKVAEKLYQALRVKNIQDLKRKIEDILAGKSKASLLEGFKEQSLRNVLRGIEILERQTGRMLLSQAYPIAEEVLSFLRADKNVLRTEAVGSLRRMKETIGDIDVVAASRHPQAVIEDFIHFPFVKEIISHGETKATIIHQSGQQIDLEILPQLEYGSLLQHFTGSKEHNIALRTWAEKQGLSISEHGIKVLSKRKNIELIRCSSEEKVYQTLRMQTPPPELRENRGEIEAALQGKLPRLVVLTDIKADLHMHTTDSDGRYTIEEMARGAKKLGYQYIGIADHTKALGMVHGLDEKKILQQKRIIESLNKKDQDFYIFSGIEVNILADGNLDIEEEILSQVELVTASIHSGFYQDKEKITQRLIKAIENPHVDIIGHPAGRMINHREEFNLDWDLIFQKAKEHQVILEINAQPIRLDLSDTLCQQAKEYGVKFVINTDAHGQEQLENMRYGLAVARRGWLEKKDIINTLSLREFQTCLRK